MDPNEVVVQLIRKMMGHPTAVGPMPIDQFPLSANVEDRRGQPIERIPQIERPYLERSTATPFNYQEAKRRAESVTPTNYDMRNLFNGSGFSGPLKGTRVRASSPPAKASPPTAEDELVQLMQQLVAPGSKPYGGL